MQLQWQRLTQRFCFFPGKESASEKPWTHSLTDLPTSFPFYNSNLFPWPFEDLHVAPHSCKHWTTIFHWYHKPVSAREMSDTLFVSCQQRGRGLTWSGDLWKTQKGNLFPWHIWKDSNWHLSGWWHSMIKIKKKSRKKLQVINLLGSLVFHKDTPHL